MIKGNLCLKRLLPHRQMRLPGVEVGVRDMGRLKIRLETEQWIYEEYDIE